MNPFRAKHPAEPAPLKPPKFDVDRALEVELRVHPTVKKHRADNGELILMVQRDLHAAEKLLARFVRVNRERRIVLDKYGEFMLNTAVQPGVCLADVAEAMSGEFDIDLEHARMGVIQLVKELMLRGFVFLVQRPPPSADAGIEGSESNR